MVNQVTYKQLVEVAQTTGMSLKEVIKARGISEEELADMKLRDEMSNAAGSNVDAANFKYSKVIQLSQGDMTQLFQILSTNDFVGKTDAIKELAPGVFEKMSSMGYENLRIQNGRLYAEKTDENGNVSKVYWTLNPEEEALTGEDGSKLIAEVVVTGKGPELRKHINKYGNEYASKTGVSTGTFNAAYNSVAEKLDNMSDEQKTKTAADVKEYAEAVKNGDAEKQTELARTILKEIGSPDGWLNPTNGEMLNPAIALVAAIAYVDYNTPAELKEALGFAGDLAAGYAEAAAITPLLPVMALAGCSLTIKDEDNIDIGIGINDVDENSTFDQLMSVLTRLLERIADTEDKIANNTQITNEKIDELNANLDILHKDLEKVKGYLVTIITNQEKSAENADKYFQLILNAIGNNSDLLAIVVDELSMSNETLESIRDLMLENNADNKLILEAITKCKYGLDQLHTDNDDIKKLLKDIKNILANLPDDLKEKFGGYFNQIIAGIADNGEKIKSLAGLLKLLNNNVVANGETQQKILEAIAIGNGAMIDGFNTLIKLGQENNNLQGETNKLINVVIDLIKKMPSSATDLDALIAAINENTVAVNNHGQNMEFWLQSIYTLLDKILGAIQDLDADCVEQFKAVIEAIGNKTDVDLSKIEDTLDAILQAIKDHKVKIIIEDNRAVPGDGVNEGEIDPETQTILDDLNWLLG